LYDLVRIDHFRGFAGYWEVPAGEPTAEKGQWVQGPGADLFTKIVYELGSDLPIIAEDLGEITPDVIELRRVQSTRHEDSAVRLQHRLDR